MNLGDEDNKFPHYVTINNIDIVCGDNKAMGFLYRTDTPLAMISNLVSDPASDQELRREAVQELVSDLMEIAKLQGYNQVSCATNIKSLGLRFEHLGFLKTDENVSHYRRAVCQ